MIDLMSEFNSKHKLVSGLGFGFNSSQKFFFLTFMVPYYKSSVDHPSLGGGGGGRRGFF